MTLLWLRLWLANRLLDAAMRPVPPAERERLRRVRAARQRLTSWLQSSSV
jgi:hypothetical protein